MKSLARSEVEDLPAAEPANGVAQLLRDCHRAVSRGLAARIAAQGVSIGQWYFLRALWEEDGLTQRELSHRVGMVTALNGMEKRGLVERVRNARDRRKMNIYLTEKGKSLRSKLVPVEEGINELALKGMTEAEQALFDRALRQVLANLSEDD